MAQQFEYWYGDPFGCRRCYSDWAGAWIAFKNGHCRRDAGFRSAGLVGSVWLHDVYGISYEGFARAVLAQVVDAELAVTAAIPTCSLGSRIRRLRVRLDGNKGECAGSVVKHLTVSPCTW